MSRGPKPYEVEWDAPEGVFLASLTASLELDSPGQLIIRAAMDARAWKALGPGSAPESARLCVGGKAVFSGTLTQVRQVASRLVEMQYNDALFAWTGAQGVGFVRNTQLESLLCEVAPELGLRARFFGGFQQEVMGRDLAGCTRLQWLQALSRDFGFHFYCHSPAQELWFVRLGSSRETVAVEMAQALEFQSVRGARELCPSLALDWFDSNSGEARRTNLGPEELHQGLGFLKQAGSLQARLGWKQAGSGVAVGLSGPTELAQWEDRFRNQLAKRALGSELMEVRLAGLSGLPGDRIELKGCTEGTLEGPYLVEAVRVEITSSQPSCQLRWVRL